MYEIFGEFDSAEEINMAAAGLLEEGDIDNILVLGKENGLEDMASIYSGGALNELTDPMMAAIGKLNVERGQQEVMDSAKRIPAEPIIEYLQSRCMEEEIARAIRKKGKSIIDCLTYIEKEAKRIVTKERPYLSDMTVFLMALDYYTKEGELDAKETSAEPAGN